jgi:hypothetical protein
MDELIGLAPALSVLGISLAGYFYAAHLARSRGSLASVAIPPADTADAALLPLIHGQEELLDKHAAALRILEQRVQELSEQITSKATETVRGDDIAQRIAEATRKALRAEGPVEDQRDWGSPMKGAE